MKSDKLTRAFFWLIFITGIAVAAGIYWLIVVALPALVTLLPFLIKNYVRNRTLEKLGPRPEFEMELEGKATDRPKYDGPQVAIVELDKYSDHHKEIASNAQITRKDTLAFEGTLRAFTKQNISGKPTMEDVVILAFVDYLVVGEIRNLETEAIARPVLESGGVVRFVLNTTFGADGKVHAMSVYPFPKDQK